MKELKLAKSLIKDAEFAFRETEIGERPAIFLDKEVYKKYNFELLKQELNKLNYELTEIEDAIAPLNDFVEHFPNKNKLIVWKKD